MFSAAHSEICSLMKPTEILLFKATMRKLENTIQFQIIQSTRVLHKKKKKVILSLDIKYTEFNSIFHTSFSV